MPVERYEQSDKKSGRWPKGWPDGWEGLSAAEQGLRLLGIVGFLAPIALAGAFFQFWLIYQASPLWCLVTFLLSVFRGLALGIIFPKGTPWTPPKASNLPLGFGWITLSIVAWFGFSINFYAVLLHSLQQLASSLGH